MRPRIAFLTGQSDPARCALSAPQAALLSELQAQAHGIDCEMLNYPWRANSAEWQPVPLWRASLANARQYLAARRGVEPTLPAAREWLNKASRSLLLVGSCGLSLLEEMLRDAGDDQRTRLRVIAYGAVGPCWPRGVQCHALLGRRDWIARLLGPRPAAHGKVMRQTLDCGHMDYLLQPNARAAVLGAARDQLDWLRAEPRDGLIFDANMTASCDSPRELRNVSDAT